MSHDPVDVVNAFGAAWNSHDLDTALSFCAEDFTFETTSPPDGERVVGHAAVLDVWKPIFQNARGRVDVEETIVAGDRVIQRCRYDWGDGHVRSVDIYRVANGKIVEKLSYVKG